MRKLFSALWLCALTLIASIPAHSQNTGTPNIHTYSYSDQSVVTVMSDNGAWALAQPATSEAQKSGRARIIDLSTNEATKLQTDAEVERDGICVVSDVTDDGNMVVGTVKGMPAYWNKSTGEWTTLPIPTGWLGGSITAVTPDGKYAVGQLSNKNTMEAGGVMWNLTTKAIIPLTNLPELDMTHNKYNQTRFIAVSNDGRYIAAKMSFSYISPASLCNYLYDTQNQTYKFIGFTPSDTKAWTPDVEGLKFVDDMSMSPNGKWIACWAYVTNHSDETFGEEGYTTLRMNTETGKTEVFKGSEDNGIVPFCIDDDGTVYGASPANTSPIREWSVRCGEFWYPISNILSQKYGIDYYNKTGYSSTGSPVAVSVDHKRIATVVDSYGRCYILDMPQPLSEICPTINLLGNYTASPASGSTISRLGSINILFDRDIKVLGKGDDLAIKDENGNTVRSSLSVTVSNGNAKTLVVGFRPQTLEAGKKYTVDIPADYICLSKDNTKTNDAISLEYTGRQAGAVDTTGVYPANGTELAKFDNQSSFVRFTFNCPVAVTDSASAKLVNVTEGTDVCSMNVAARGNIVDVYPASTQFLYQDVDYKVVLSAGSVTDVTGNGPNTEKVMEYKGTYMREITPDDDKLFYDDFSNISQSLINFMRYEGDHNTPIADRVKEEFDADNQPWNFSLRDDNAYNYCAASHSMYTPAGKSDDWMVIPQIKIPDEFCFLAFDAQSYLKDKKDSLKVIVYENDKVINNLTTTIVNDMKLKGDTVFSELLNPGLSEDELADDWTHYTVDLSKYSGKNIYIAFVNDNKDQSMVFVDSVLVKHNMKALVSLSTKASVVNKENATVAGKVTANADNDTFSSIKLTLVDGEGNKLDEISQSGLALKKGDEYPFSFSKLLPLTVGESNSFTIKLELDKYTTEVKSAIKNLTFDPKKRVVLEEMTGITCPNCPLGILAIENLEKSVGDQIIPISIHTYTGDPMGTGLSAYSTFLNLVAAPTGVINRNGQVSSPMWTNPGTGYHEFSNGYNLWLDYVNAELDVPADAEISASVTLSEDEKTFSIPVKVRYALNAKNLNLNLFTVILEDGIVSYQDNNLGSVSEENLGEWGKGGKYENGASNITHNDVVRYCYGDSYNGTAGFLPQSMTAGAEYTADLNGFTTPDNITNIHKAKAVIMLIDGSTDKVINAVCAKFPGAPTGIENTKTDDNACTIDVNNGNVTVTANGETTAQLYSITGTMLASAKGNGTIKLSTNGYRGTVIVKATNGSNTVVKKISLIY